MKTTTIPDSQMIDVEQIKVFVSRARGKQGFEEMKASMKGVGLKKPIEVRDITHLPSSQRRRPDGGTYRFELTKGEGRLTAARQLGWSKVPAYVMNVPEADIPGRFLAENKMRRAASWLEKARLVKSEFDAGATTEQVAKLLFIEPKHALRLHRIITRATSEADLEKMSLADAEALTTLPKDGQAIVLEVMQETGERQIRSLVNKARETMEEKGELSKLTLKASLNRVQDDLKRMREQLKVKRVHDSLGPQNVELLLGDDLFAAAAKKEGINVEKVLAALNA